jgi:hypothetical protein
VERLARGKSKVLALSAGVCAMHGQAVDQLGPEMQEAPMPVPTVCAVWEPKLRGVPCGHCHKLDGEPDMVVCDRCSTPYHQACVALSSPVVKGPWYCNICRGAIRLAGYADPVEDLALLDYLFRGLLPDDECEYRRVRSLASVYRARGEELETHVRPYGAKTMGRWVPVPPKPMRTAIV